MNYDKKYVTSEFLEALKKVVTPESELDEMMADGKPNAIDPNKDKDKKVYNKEDSKPAPASDSKKSYHEDTELESEAVELTEEEIISALEEELTPHISHLLDEGFSEDEIELLILNMLADEENEEEEADDSERDE